MAVWTGVKLDDDDDDGDRSVSIDICFLSMCAAFRSITTFCLLSLVVAAIPEIANRHL